MKGKPILSAGEWIYEHAFHIMSLAIRKPKVDIYRKLVTAWKYK
jgi:hypothetical protein